MRKMVVSVAVLAAITGGAIVVAGLTRQSVPTAWDRMPKVSASFDHSAVCAGPFESGPAVTARCLECHPQAAREVMKTSHWTWAGQKVKLPGREEVMQVGKRNLLNNFCIHAGPNMQKCSSCHAGYGWTNNDFDFTEETNVDCLVCHDQTNTYQKGDGGYPVDVENLALVAQHVGRPTRKSCGQCHFKGGGGDAVKHGDMDSSMYYPHERVDVHMGKLDFQCVDCHRTNQHNIAGCAMSVCIDRPRRVNCADCHGEQPHRDERLDFHTGSVACQTCHIPRMAIDAPTKMYWDWSQAGQEGREEDPQHYLKAKGEFQFAQNIRPEYHWYNGRARRYLMGDTIDPTRVVQINAPLGGPDDPEAKIWPFKVHRGRQIYDAQLHHLLAPRTAAPGGYWREFDWDKACRLGAEDIGLEYSGEYDFVDTEMYWPLSHMVQTSERALQCIDCHGPRGVLAWEQLGYDGDPAYRGNRRRMGLLRDELGAGR